MAKKNPTGSCCDAPIDAAEARQAAGVDHDIKEANLARLRRIEGQVRGVQKMIEEDRYCPDILTQLTAVQQALRGVARDLVRNHMRHCVAAAVQQGGDAAEQVYEEMADLFHRSSR